MIPQHALFSINIIQDSTGGSRVEILGEMTIDWEKYNQKVNILDCLEFGDAAQPFDANTPDISEVVYPLP